MKKFIIVILICLFFGSFIYLNKNVELKNNNEKFIKTILKLSNSHFNNEQTDNNIYSLFISKLNSIDINSPVTLLETSLAYNYEKSFSYVENKAVPKVYIYSTHPSELYNSDYLEGYDITPGVIMASYILQEELNKLGIITIVEEKRTSDYIKENNLSYEDSYKGSREYVNDILNTYPDLELIIDLHRDAVDKSVTTVTINEQSYAKVMFVQNKSLPNISLAQIISDKLNNNYPDISRGLYTKHNSKFNQDLNNNMILLELGGNYNTIEEVVNTIKVLANTIKETLDERK